MSLQVATGDDSVYHLSALPIGLKEGELREILKEEREIEIEKEGER